jgi:predicted nucleic acid-binding protein
MSVFVDTSALLALLDADDEHHPDAVAAWHRLQDEEPVLVTSNYVMLETIAVAQRRLGLDAVRTFATGVAPLLDVHFVDEAIHSAAMAAVLAASRRDLSLVDCSSFEVMRRGGVTRAYAYDRHFAEQGFLTEA